MAITLGISNSPNMAQQAAQMQAQFADQLRMKVLAGVQGGSINQNEFRALAHSLDQGPIPTTQPAAADTAQIQQAADQLQADRGGMPGFANQAAQFQMFATDQKQAQSIYEEISARSKNFNSLYDKYSHGEFQPQTQLAPGEGARLDRVFTQLKSGQLNSEQALALLRGQ